MVRVSGVRCVWVALWPSRVGYAEIKKENIGAESFDDVEITSTMSKEASRDDRNTDDSIFSAATTALIYMQEMRDRGRMTASGMGRMSEIERRGGPISVG